MKNSLWFFLHLLFCSCVPITKPIGDNTTPIVSKKLLYVDHTYEQSIRTVQLTPKGNRMLPAVARIHNEQLNISFDDLSEEADTYRVRIINCNRSWRPSGLNSLEYLTDYNEFDIINYEFSFDTATPYVHYTFDLPTIKRSGNYLLIVYRADNSDDIIITRRFMIVEPLIDISPITSLNGLTNLSSFNQQINFTVSYPNYSIDNPLVNLSITIRQNHRDDNSVQGLRPSFTREDINQLEYRFFDHQNTFSAVNEFRFFDLRSLIYPGQNVKSVNRSTNPPKTIIATDKPRTNLAYAQYNDNNGQYSISEHSDVNGQYTNVTFNLDINRTGHIGDVFLFGEFTDWRIADKYQMMYDDANKTYSKEILLKQGYYEYQYLTTGDSTAYYIEGNHYQTENTYEIFAYYKPFNEKSDLIIGYYVTSRSGNSP